MDRLSRSRDPSAPIISRAVLRLLITLLSSVMGKGAVFWYRLSGGENPVAQRKQAQSALQEVWGDGCARFFNPPKELLGLTLSNKKKELEPWTETSSTVLLRRLEGNFTTIVPTRKKDLVVWANAGTDICPLLFAEVGLRDAQPAGRSGLTVDEELASERWAQLRANSNKERTERRERTAQIRRENVRCDCTSEDSLEPIVCA